MVEMKLGSANERIKLASCTACDFGVVLHEFSAELILLFAGLIPVETILVAVI